MFAYFIDTMLDGGDMQMLWTYGAEGTHWSRAAETVLDKTYEEGTFHFLENLEKAGTLYTKNHIDPMLSLASFAEGYPDPSPSRKKPVRHPNCSMPTPSWPPSCRPPKKWANTARN